MKYLLLITLFTINFSTLAALPNDQEVRYSNTGYPYNLLIQRSDSIKIIYTEKNDKVVCRISIENTKGVQTSLAVDTSKAKFEQEPLASCLPRKLAKQWLAQTF